MNISDVLDYVESNDIKFIRLVFCDIFGKQKNLAIMPNELPHAFETGISFDASAIRGFLNIERSDLFLVPEEETMLMMPWRSLSGRVMRYYCHIRTPDNQIFEGDCRQILKNTQNTLETMGYDCNIGVECEFYLLKTDNGGTPTEIPQDFGGYCDIAPLDQGENIRREICLTLEKMGIYPEVSHHEQGPGQNEIDFRYNDPLTTADHLTAFKATVKAIAGQNGLFASFMPKLFTNYSGSGMHTNLSLTRNGKNIFSTENGALSEEGAHFIAGIMNRIREITLFLNPITNSYSRLGTFEAPKYITWSAQNRSQLIRIPAADGKHARMELRSPDMRTNPYIAFTLLLEAGMEGIRKSLPLPGPVNANMYTIDAHRYETLPQTLLEAVKAAENSEFVASVLPKRLIEKFIEVKISEWETVVSAEDKDVAERNLYFYDE